MAGGHDFNAWPHLFANVAKLRVAAQGFVNGAPVFTAGGETQSVDENRMLRFGVEATDPDGDAVTYSASGLPPGASFDPTSQHFSWLPVYTRAGTLSHLHGK